MRKRTKPTTAAGDALLTLQEVAAYLQVAERTVYLWAQAGTIPSFKLGNIWRFKRADLEAWFEEQKRATQRTSHLPSGS